MAKITKNILSLNHEEVMDFFMKYAQSLSFELSKYLAFDEILKYVRRTTRHAPYEMNVQAKISPDNLSNVNLDILLNKDGQCAIRLIMLTSIFLQSVLTPDFYLRTRQDQRDFPIYYPPLPVRSRSKSKSLIEKRLILFCFRHQSAVQQHRG